MQLRDAMSTFNIFVHAVWGDSQKHCRRMFPSSVQFVSVPVQTQHPAHDVKIIHTSSVCYHSQKKKVQKLSLGLYLFKR